MSTVDFATFLNEWNTLLNRPTTEDQTMFIGVLTHGAPERKIHEPAGAENGFTASVYVAWSLLTNPTKSFVWIGATQQIALADANVVKDVIARHPRCTEQKQPLIIVLSPEVTQLPGTYALGINKFS